MLSERDVANERSFQWLSHVLVFEISDVSGVTHMMSIMHIFSRGLRSGKTSVKIGMENKKRSKVITLLPLKARYQNSSLKFVSLDGSSHEKNTS